MLKDTEIILSRFIEWMEIQGWSDRTIENYSLDVRSFFRFLENETSISDIKEITNQTIHGYQTWLYNVKTRQGKSLTLSSQHKKLTSIKSFFRYLVDTEYLLFDPASSLKLPKRSKHLPKGVMTEKQVEKILDQPDLKNDLGFRDRTIMEVLYATGIRNSELRALTIYDIDLKESRLTVRQGKNSKDRILPIGQIARDFLAEYMKVIRPRLIKDKSQTLLFISKNGQPLNRPNLIWIIHKYVRKSRLEKLNIGPHSFRHSCATHMLQHGAGLRYIQELLGHASVATTQIYTFVEKSDLKAVHQRCHPREIE